jgi:NAD-dependent deacetylase
MLPSEQIDRAFEHAGLADVMLVIGSSLLVAPVSNLPGYVLANRGALAILNEGETPYDTRATVRLHTKAAETMPGIMAALDALNHTDLGSADLGAMIPRREADESA